MKPHGRHGSALQSSLAGLAVALTFGAVVPWAQDGSVRVTRKISETSGGFAGPLRQSDFFGTSLAALGDLDGDGVGDLAVGAFGDDGDRGRDGLTGAVWILFLEADGTVRSAQKINEDSGGFEGELDPGDSFGISVAALGDLDGDGVGDLAVGAYRDDDGGSSQGAVWILFLNPDGTVSSEQSRRVRACAGSSSTRRASVRSPRRQDRRSARRGERRGGH